MSATDALRAALVRLAGAGVADPARDARLLLAEAMGIGADRLTLHLDDPLSADAVARFESLVRSREGRQPVSQILGRRAFWGRDFRVTPDVLDPRPDTETLVAEALRGPFTRVLDLGTGSGAILVSLLADRPAATGLGVDLSPAALAVAQGNGERLGVAARAAFILSDWFSAVQGAFDLIVSNPPYIADHEMPSLAPEVRDHEPRMALTPGGDGLGAYRILAGSARRHLSPGGRVVLEIGPTQGDAVTDLLRAAGFCEVRVLKDLEGRNRVVAALAP